MQITMTPTDIIETIEGAPARRWVGITENRIPVHVWVRCLSPQTQDPEALAVFDKELQTLPPARKELVSFDLRFVV